jgi:protease-4
VVTALVVSIVSLMTVVGLVLAAVVATGGGTGLALGGRVAVLEVEGVIADDQDFLRDVKRLREDPSVRAWVVVINSPGGVVAPAQSMYRELRRIREEDGVPVVAAIGSVGASGGYYIALAADSILALPGSITGSIGVIMEYPNVSGLMERVGVRMEVVKAGAQKDLGSPFRPMDEADREILNALVDDVHAQFMETVAEARGMSVEEVRPMADGRVFSGRQALERRLVDRLGNREAAIALAGRMAGLGPDPHVVRPPEDEVPWLARLLFGETTARTIQSVGASVSRTGSWPALEYIVH